MLTLKMHTVILLVGPSGCGKSYFSKNHLIPALKASLGENAKIQYLSSDDLRREILGNDSFNYKENSFEMMSVSEQAFNLLNKKLELLTSYPVNSDFVIVDTTGLSKRFRDDVVTKARASCYNTCCIVFKYKNRGDYYKYIEETHDLKLVSNHVKRFNREVLGELGRKDFDTLHFLRRKDFEDFEVEIEDFEQYLSHFLPANLNYSIFGDIHGDYDAFLALLKQLNFKVEDGLITDKPVDRIPIILGDFVDGASLEGIEKTIRFLHANKEHFKFVTGNHENFVYKYIKKEIKPAALPSPEFLDAHFPTTKLLEQKPELAEKFCELREMSKDFYLSRRFIVTHAPCEDKYLGKMHRASLTAQRNFRYPHWLDEDTVESYSTRLEDALSFLPASAAFIKPLHIFGHCRVQNVFKVKNKIGIDTGSCQGNRLTAASVVGDCVFFNSVNSELPKNEELALIFHKKKADVEELPEVDINELDPREMARIRYAAKHKVNYISGTMCPADKDEVKGTLESMEKCLDYFLSKSVDKVCLQPKYMGSRAELFLNCKDVSLSYTTTRRGHIIDKDYVNLTDACSKVLEHLLPFAKEHDYEWLLLDCELMPWHALGKGLIETQYNPVKVGIESELQLLKETGFSDQIGRLFNDYDEIDFSKLASQVKKEDLKKQLQSHKYANYEAIKGFQWIRLEEQEEYLEIFKRQLELYASEGEIHFKPFSLLKAINSSGDEHFFYDMTNSEQFALVSSDKCIVVDTESGLEEAQAFFKSVVDAELEGVVVKPEQPYIKGVAPFMKVRSEAYLHLIYGADFSFAPKYERLVRQKRISRKLQTSIDEYEYGKRMLEIPRCEIAIENKAYVSLFAKLIFEEKKEEKFDPRL